MDHHAAFLGGLLRRRVLAGKPGAAAKALFEHLTEMEALQQSSAQEFAALMALDARHSSSAPVPPLDPLLVRCSRRGCL